MHWLNMFHQIKIRISIIISVTLALCIQRFSAYTEIHIRLQSLCNSHRERETHRHADTYITLIWGINPRVLKQKPNFTHKNFARERKGMFFFCNWNSLEFSRTYRKERHIRSCLRFTPRNENTTNNSNKDELVQLPRCLFYS